MIMLKPILDIALMFVLRAVAKWGLNVDWTKAKADVEPRIRKVVPGELFDSFVVATVNALIDTAAGALGQTGDVEKILRFIAQNDWGSAMRLLVDLMITKVPGANPAINKFLASVEVPTAAPDAGGGQAA